MRASHPPASHLCLFCHILCTQPNMEQVVSAYPVRCVAKLIIPLVWMVDGGVSAHARCHPQSRCLCVSSPILVPPHCQGWAAPALAPQIHIAACVGTMHQLWLIFYEILWIRNVSLSGIYFAGSLFCLAEFGTNLPNMGHYCAKVGGGYWSVWWEETIT